MYIFPPNFPADSWESQESSPSPPMVPMAAPPPALDSRPSGKQTHSPSIACTLTAKSRTSHTLYVWSVCVWRVLVSAFAMNQEARAREAFYNSHASHIPHESRLITLYKKTNSEHLTGCVSTPKELWLIQAYAVYVM